LQEWALAAAEAKTCAQERVQLLEAQLRGLQQSDAEALILVLKDYDSLKDKVTKLKSLLGRSAKAQREAKVDLDATQKRLDNALREIDRLNRKVDKLANRPTHMELLADFEANFDRALLSANHHYQAGGEETSPQYDSSTSTLTHHHTSSNHNNNNPHYNTQQSLQHQHQQQEDSALVDSLLMQELAESKQRIEKLEQLNHALLHRSSQLEVDAQERQRERDDLTNKIAHLELEKRMAVMEAEHASKTLQEKAASLAEMQMEMELVTQASVKSHARASRETEWLKSVRTDQHYVHQLETQVQALQEWALAAAEAKTCAQERVQLLEAQLRGLQQSVLSAAASSSNSDTNERVLWSLQGSMVVGAADVGMRVVEWDLPASEPPLSHSERVVLRWKFDLTTEDRDIVFSIAKGKCEAIAKRRSMEYFIQDRAVKGGAAGETEHAFSMQNACTLLWSNEKSWIRPRTVKYTITVVAVTD
jgi:hypothetical protein